jgi:hypothetical protein
MAEEHSKLNGGSLSVFEYLRVVISESSRQISETDVSYPNFLDWRERARTFDQLAAFQESSYALTGT